MKTVSISKRLYQRQIPIFVVSFVIAVMLVQYIVVNPIIEEIRKEMLLWANIVSLIVWLFANVVLVLNNARRVVRAREDRRMWYESILILGSLAFFLLLAFSNPAQMEKNTNYVTVYRVLIGAIYLGIEATALTYQNYNIIRRLSTQKVTPEVVVLVLTCVIMWLRGMTVITYNYPQVFAVANWVEQVAYGSATRAATVVLAIGSLILATRALVGREPGIIEMEMA